MNKRQRKKNFKKRYGTNPREAIQKLNVILPRISSELVNVFKSMVAKIVDFTKQLPEQIKDMPEEKFQLLMEDADLSMNAKLNLLRMRKGDFD